MDKFTSISNQAMFEVWGRTPRGYQSYVISHILKMTKHVINPGAVLMVQATGSGKSSIPQTVGVVDGGITIIIENTLALSSDQMSKLSQSNTKKNIVSFQLDEIKTSTQQTKVISSINTALLRDRSLSIFLFTSPEALLKDVWLSFFKTSLSQQHIKLLCIDEVHLFVDFGLTFRKNFLLLKEKIFKLVTTNNDSCLKIPILYMTATFNIQKLHFLKQLTGINVLSQNIFWGDYISFQRRNIYISTTYTNQSMKKLKLAIQSCLLTSNKNKCIVYTSTAAKAQSYKNKTDDWLDSINTIPGDTGIVVGDQETELKHAYSTEFTTTNTEHAILDERKYTPRILFGTSGCIGAGLDSNDVKLVFRIGMPTSILNFIQEMGRCGRLKEQNISQNKNIFDLNFNLHDFVYLHQRLYIIEDSNDDNSNTITSNDGILSDEIIQNPNDVRGENNDLLNIISIEEERNIQRNELKMTAQLLCLEVGCFHSFLEWHSGNPSLRQWFRHIPCIDLCPDCDGSKPKMIKTVSKIGLSTFIAESLIYHKYGVDLSPQQLSEALFKYPNVGKTIYNRPNSIKAESTTATDITIMQLLASGIIEMCITEGKKPKVSCKIGINISSATPYYLIPYYWNQIKHY
jgi:superfamily II DNA or RNA helicase